MIVLSHRGYWRTPAEKNTELAFRRSFGLEFGTETDVRDQYGQLVISHDTPVGGEMPFDSFLETLGGKELPLAINVKADGLAGLISRAMAGRSRDSWFVFDMSVPDMRAHLAEGNPVFARMSEVESEPPWFDRVSGIWLDAFEDVWFDAALIRRLLREGKRVCVVSPELHGRTQDVVWEMLRPLAAEDRLMLCTDVPEQAQAYFAGATE